jgi:hypothetical protein
MVVDYSKGKIFKITSPNTDKIYIGSTCQALSMWLGGLNSIYKTWKQGKSNAACSYQAVFEIFESGNVEITLIEKFPSSSKEELTARKREWINKVECINLVIPKTAEEKKTKLEQNKQSIKNRNEFIKTEEGMKEHLLNKTDFNCECGRSIRYSQMKKHLTSKNNKHTDKFLMKQLK